MFKTLKQGKVFDEYQQKLKNKVSSSSLALISVGKLNIVNNLNFAGFVSVKEGMANAPLSPNAPASASISAVEAVNEAELNALRVLEGQFNEKMIVYQETYKKYLEELVTKQSSSNTTFKNQIVKYDGDYYYINNMGTARQFSANAWTGRDQTSCPAATTKTITDEQMQRLSRGTTMGIGEICRSGGWNAKDRGSGTTAWVDNNGQKHRYIDFREKNSTCPDTSTTITSQQFNAIPWGTDFGPKDTCDIISLDGDNYDKLVKLNTDLMTLVNTMNTNVKNLKVKDKNLEDKVTEQKDHLMDIYGKLKKEKDKVNKLKTENRTLMGEADEQNLDVSAIQMHHLIWLVLGCTFVATAVIHMNKN